MLWWLKKLIRHPARIGSIAPSSRFLARLMARELKPGMHILELGPGEGAITRRILEKIGAAEKLTLLERDPELADICAKKFPDCELLRGDAADILERETRTFDAILSGIPFAVMHEEKRQRVFTLIRDHLEPNGSFIMFQYSRHTLHELKDIFPRVEVNFTFKNLPPAFVFTCRN
jgi:phospholipid N-methyltransferase